MKRSKKRSQQIPKKKSKKNNQRKNNQRKNNQRKNNQYKAKFILKNVSKKRKAELAKINGFGQITFDDGTIQEGFFNKGQLEGKGISKEYSKNKLYRIREGQFKNGMLNGKGRTEQKQFLKLICEGNFVNDKLNGQGKKIYDGLRIEEGNFKDDNLNGQGKIIDKMKNREIVYEEGTYITPRAGSTTFLSKGIRKFKNGTIEKGSFKRKYDNKEDYYQIILEKGTRKINGTEEKV